MANYGPGERRTQREGALTISLVGSGWHPAATVGMGTNLRHPPPTSPSPSPTTVHQEVRNNAKGCKDQDTRKSRVDSTHR